STSRADGYFELQRVPGYDTLACRLAGYREWQLFIATDQQEVIISLDQPMDGPEVVIEGEQRAQELNLLDAQRFQTLNEKELCKAACCSLSESFETNASVDASYTDAITGTRQIKMLGLDGKYTQVMFDNIPAVRGLATIYGLGYLPGPWIREIAITKGAGSVVAGYESITGQINVAHKSS
ncbi:MAG: TonB-dependent receptor plug domain-containing protein, partial [Bacteroidota bacterium]